jgi:cyclohexa-1,5-dienecarbonyl-CoA hydratase
MPDQAPVDSLSVGRVTHLTLARPPLNILDLDTIAALDRALVELPPGTQVVTLRGRGGKAFSAGVSVQDHVGEKIEPMLVGFHGVLRRLLSLDAIVLAIVEGHCLGGGMELAMACDLVLADEGARFGQPEIQLGCYPPFAAALYPALIGPQRTAELLLAGRTLGAAEALEWGLVNWLAPASQLDEKARAVVSELTRHSAAVTSLAKRAIAAGRRQPWSAALVEAERLYLQDLTATKDMHEGIAAFLERRKPNWGHD